MRIQISHRVTDQMRAQILHVLFSIIILSLSDVCESTQGVCELAVGETTRLRNDRLPFHHMNRLVSNCAGTKEQSRGSGE